MKCAVAIVLALFGVATAVPVPSSLGWGVGPVLLPSAVSVSSSVINHGISLPVVKPIISAPIITAPIIRTPIIAAPVIRSPIISPLGLTGLGLGGLGGLGHGWHG
ncbi:uncharacterized protein LOC125237931 [Leguminivora glycinivorella]|uniref:uncharacterized protein LOC125237931 n=1 Tax=Leguminivora glycinivorella TaxID=1035111 RepID=UPI00200C612C|nr:uncharacterized protein LOC125237931 [Leguminivora glycinivorella]